MSGWDFLLLRIPKCWREDDSRSINALFCFSISFSLSKRFICVGIYIWVVKNETIDKGLSEIRKTELKGQASQ